MALQKKELATKQPELDTQNPRCEMRQLTTSCTHAHTVTETEIHTERKNNNTHTIHESNKKILKTLLGDDVLLRGPFYSLSQNSE